MENKQSHSPSETQSQGLLHRVVSWLTGKATKSARLAAAKKVKQAFDDVDWKLHTFISNGVTMTTTSGETKFYEAGEIDAAIKRLNKALKELSS